MQETQEINKHYIDGFDDCLDMLFNLLDNLDRKALFSVHKFITGFKEILEEEAELHKTDG